MRACDVIWIRRRKLHTPGTLMYICSSCDHDNVTGVHRIVKMFLQLKLPMSDP
jgi:hypothetical protein